MPLTILAPLVGFAATALGATLLYAASEHQRLLRQRPAPLLLLLPGLAALLVGTGAWISATSGLVGGLLALAVWMAVSIALPYLLARRRF